MNDIILSTQNGEPVASSREVAKRFGKEHKNVMQAVANLVAENSAAKSMFHPATFENRGKKYPMYLMNRDGFALLAMGFTGKEAVTWKLKYIEAFNQMEKQLAAQRKDQQAVQDENIQRAIDQVIAARKRLDEQTAFLDKRREARDKSKALYLRVKALCSQTKAGYSEDCDIVRTMETVVRSSQDFLNSAVDQLTIVAKGYPAYLALMNDIYDMFDLSANVYTDAERPVGMQSLSTRTITVDYGTLNACTYLDTYDDGETIRIDREYRWDGRKERRQKTDEEYADDFMAFMGNTPCAVYVDPSAASFIAALRQRGVYVLDANNDVLNGIRRCSTLFSRRRLLVNASCTGLIDELGLYRWDDKAALLGVEKPVKENDHGPDAVRYYINSLPDWRFE